MLICGCSKNKNKDMYLGTELQHLRRITQFQASEILEIRSRFYKLTNGNKEMEIRSFRDMMGFAGMDERIYKMIDIDQDSKISFKEYISYLNIMIHGNQQNKQDYTYNLIDIDKKGYFDIDTFSELIKLFIGLWSNVTGNTFDAHAQMKLDQHICNIFEKLDPEKTNRVDISMFRKALSFDPNLLEIFDFIGKGMHENIVINEGDQKKTSFKFAKEIFKIEMGIQNVIESVKAIKLKGDNSIRNTNFSRSVINPNQRNSEKRHYEAKSEVKMRMAKTIGEYKQEQSPQKLVKKCEQINKDNSNINSQAVIKGVIDENDEYLVNSVAVPQKIDQYTTVIRNDNEKNTNHRRVMSITIERYDTDEINEDKQNGVNLHTDPNDYENTLNKLIDQKILTDVQGQGLKNHGQLQKKILIDSEVEIDIVDIDIDLQTFQSQEAHLKMNQQDLEEHYQRQNNINQGQESIVIQQMGVQQDQKVNSQELETIEAKLKGLLNDTLSLRKQIEQDVYINKNDMRVLPDQPNELTHLVSQNIPRKKTSQQYEKRKSRLDTKFKGMVFFGHQNQTLIQNMTTGIMMAVRSAQQNN